MESIFGANIWCDLDTLRFIIERNPGSVVILVGVVGFLFYRLQKFLVDLLKLLFVLAPFGKKTKAAIQQCLTRYGGERDQCLTGVLHERVDTAWKKIRWVFETFLNVVAVLLLVLGISLCYLIVSPPTSCAVPGESGIYVPSVFKKISDKGGEILYADETNRSYVRIWPGARARGATFDELYDRYEHKKAEALKNATSKTFDTDTAPSDSRRYFVVSWRDRDNFDVYFVSRLVTRGDGRATIDSLEISSPVHGNALIGLDYKILFCNFVKPSATDVPEDCKEL